MKKAKASQSVSQDSVVVGPSKKKVRLDTGLEQDTEHLGTPSMNASNNGLEEADGLEESQNSLFPFQDFATHKVLFTDPRSKSICVLGSCVGSGERGVVLAEKQPLTESTLPHLFSSCLPEKKFQNDVYSQYLLDCKGGVGEVRVTTVYPATDKHVQKYETQKRRFVLETPARYEEITKPFAEKQSLSLDVRVWLINKIQCDVALWPLVTPHPPLLNRP